MHVSRQSAAPSTAIPAEWITGDATVKAVVATQSGVQTQVDSVTFAPAARTVWHRHPLGQILFITAGTGRVQRLGGPIETVGVGDTVHIEPDEWHWHGAAPSVAMTHLALEPIPVDGSTPEAGDPVTDHEYHSGDTDQSAEPAAVFRHVVLDQILSSPRSTQRVEVRRITIAPGFAGGLHVHNGPVFGSIETGSVVYEIDGEPATVLGPGDVFYEPEGARIARFDAQDNGATFLGYFLLDTGQSPEIEFPAS